MKPFIALFSCWFGCLLAAAEPTVWSYTTVKQLPRDGIQLYAASGSSWEAEIPAGEKTPAGENVLALRITGSAAASRPWSKQLNFNWPNAVEPGQKYRISFYYRGSGSGEVTFSAARGTPPYGMLGRNTGWKLKVTEQWQKAEREFTVTGSSPAPQAMPRFQFGLYPVSATFFLGPVRLERLDQSFASLLSPRWEYAAESAGRLPVDRIPDGTRPVRLENDSFDIAGAEKRFGNGACALFYQEFEAPAEGRMTVGMAADWFFECFANGVSVYSTLERGNLSPAFAPENHVFNIPVKPGRNLLAVRVVSGSAGWRFVAGRVPVVTGDPETARLFRPEAGAGFRPVDDGRFLEIEPGSALDFSRFSARHTPAGRFGRLIVGTDGKPVFEKRPESPVRFFAFNWDIGNMWRGRYHQWDRATINRFADAVARRGYNLVRIHTPETFFRGWDNFLNTRHADLSAVKIPQTIPELEAVLDAGNLDRFDAIVAAFKERGIYVALDLAGRRMLAPAGVASHVESFKTRLFNDPVCRNHWKLFANYLMNRINPYTQTAYKDEPALALVTFVNEQDLRFESGLKFLTEPFRDWLRSRYGGDAALAAAWGGKVTFDTVPDITEADLRSGDRRAADTEAFLISAMREMTAWFHTTLRATGYRGLVNHWDMIMRTLELPARALLPAVAQHTYFAHPGELPVRGLVPKSVRPNSFVDNHATDCVTEQGSSLDSSYFRAAAAARFFDRPYFITEYSHCAPNRFRHERGLYFSSYAALQDWDALTAHSDTVRLEPDPFLKFDSAFDPVSRVNEALTALIYLRRDVRTAPHSVVLELQNRVLFPRHGLSAISDDYARLALVTRLGLLYPEITPLEPVGSFTGTLTLTPEEFSYLGVSQWYVRADNQGGGREKELFSLLRGKGILNAANPTDPARKLYASETGELVLDGLNETMTVVTPRLEGVILKTGRPVRLDRLTVNSCSRPASVALASLEEEKTLAAADRLLLMLTTNAFNTGQVFDTVEQRICYESGNHPALIEAARFDLTFENGRETPPECWALHFNGARAEKLPVALADGRLRLQIDTGRLKYGAAFFEISYPQGKEAHR